MELIKTEFAFQQILRADRALIFLDFAWSGQARLSAAVINEWERTSNIWGVDCPIFCVRPDELPAIHDWIKTRKDQLRGEGGYGSLIWLRSGVIVDYEPYVVGAGLRDITSRTRSLFGKKGNSVFPPSGLYDRELDGEWKVSDD